MLLSNKEGDFMADTPTWNTTGNWNKKYLDPNTDVNTAKKLYGMYGTRYNWMPLEQRLDPNYGKPTPAAPAPAPTPAAPTLSIPKATTPAATTPANSKELYPFISMGQMPQAPQMPVFRPLGSNQSTLNAAKVGNISSFMPKARAPDPIYQNQLEEGRRALDAKLSAQGLTGSGAELEANRRMLSDLTSQQAQRNLDIAKTDQATQAALAGQRLSAAVDLGQTDVTRYGNDISAANLAANSWAEAWKQRQEEANRLAQAQQNESARLTNEGNANWARYVDLLNFMQGANPLPYSQQATDSLAKIYESMGTQIPQYMMAMK